MVELIKRKRDGKALTKDEIESMINDFVTGKIPDYQVAAFLMAVYFKGLSNDETAMLTDAMMRSGDLIDLSEIKGIKVDKHSTGGVGDKTTLVLAPLVAAAGAPVAKMSGRGLGHTGGTLDKMESIKGLSVDMSKEQFIERINKFGIAICGQNASLVPADKKLYALRDVTGTVDNISLIASSIMSKKLACGADAIVIDIKIGEGAFMKTVEQAEELAKIIIAIGAKMGRQVVAVISGMYEPLGKAVGNAIEVKEAIHTLCGKGPEDLTELCLELGANMLLLGKVVNSYDEGVKRIKELIASGAGLAKLRELVIEQGGDPAYIDNPNLLANSEYSYSFVSPSEGYITKLNALSVGLASVKLGAGRATKESIIDHGAGIFLEKKRGDYVKKGETLAIFYSDSVDNFPKAEELMIPAYEFSSSKPEKQALIIKTVR